MRNAADPGLLYRLARLYGIQTAYYDVSHRRRQAPAESLLAVLGSLGAPVAGMEDIPAAWRERRQAVWRRWLEPVVVVWEGEPPVIKVRLPSGLADTPRQVYLRLETGEQRRWKWSGTGPALEAAEVEGTRYEVRQLILPDRLPWGYHRLTLETSGGTEDTLIISAPRQACVPPAGRDSRGWGVFLPLYALHSDKSWGGGDFSDLEALADWAGGLGGSVVATLPLLPTFLNDASELSPYLPVSRLMWNDFYLDINKIPELRECPPAQAVMASSSFKDEVSVLRDLPLVDYRRQSSLKRRVLRDLSEYFFARESDRRGDLRRFMKANPAVGDYACFRAAVEKQGAPWPEWSPPARDGLLRDGDYDNKERDYHLYVQWLAHQQVAGAAARAGEKGAGLYLDLPVGAHPAGYDVWRERDAFIPDASAGAPPDVVFTRGQDWEFPPMHPQRIRERGYRYVIAYLRHHLRYAGILRIDHVMGLHRLFCIPRGMESRQGVYLRYPAEELYAILALESRRHKTIIVGEDLGTVPPYVRPAMKRHGLGRMYVLHYELAESASKGLRPVSPSSVASLNTHDMPPFASFWEGRDIKEWGELGLLDGEGQREEAKNRRNIVKTLGAFLRRRGWLEKPGADAFTALRAALSFLADSRAWLVLVSLEDLWLETRPQNVPGIGDRYTSWRRRARYSLEEFCQMPRVTDTLRIIDGLRRQGSNRKG